MRMPGFTADRSTGHAARYAAATMYGGAASADLVVPQGCGIGRKIGCIAQAAACASTCATGVVPACLACTAAVAANCADCL